MENRFLLTVLLRITTAKSVLLQNTTVGNTSSVFHPLYRIAHLCKDNGVGTSPAVFAHSFLIQSVSECFCCCETPQTLQE